MRDVLVDSAVELLSLALYVAASLALTALGFLAERLGAQNVVAGDLVTGAWFTFMGAIALFAGVVLLGYERALPRLRALVA